MPAIDTGNRGMLAGSDFRVNKAISLAIVWQRLSLLRKVNFAKLGLSKSSVKDASCVPIRAPSAS